MQKLKVIWEKIKYRYVRIFHLLYTDIQKMVFDGFLYTSYKPDIMIKGDYLDFGAGSGGSLIPAWHFNKNLGNKKTRFFAFDSWEGCGEVLEKEKDFFDKGEMKHSYCDFKNKLKSYGINDVVLIKGFFEDVLNEKLRIKLNINKISTW